MLVRALRGESGVHVAELSFQVHLQGVHAAEQLGSHCLLELVLGKGLDHFLVVPL